MELESVASIRSQYRSLLGGDKRYEAVLERLTVKPDQEPIVSIQGVEAEADLSYRDEQRQLSEILLDLHAINNGIVELKDIIKATTESLDASLDTIRKAVAKQRTQAEDACILCGTGSLYSAVVPIDASYFTDGAMETIGDKTFGAMPVSLDQIAYDIVNVTGNGYSGNAFVYQKDGTFQNEKNDRSVLEYIIDNNDLTVYEYSRISTQDKTEALSGIINYDDKPVECVLTLHAVQPVSKAVLHLDDTGIVIKKIEVSDDGLNYRTCRDTGLRVNDKSEIYSSYDYIFGCPVLCFPYAAFIRLTLSNAASMDDEIAILEDDGSITQYPAAYRKKIGIRGIELYAAQYEPCTFISSEILSDCAVDKISLFVSEYIPDHFSGTDFIIYSLLVNGQEYSIVPANTGQEGITLIKYAENTTVTDNHTILINETIRSVQVKITIQPYNGNETPYISNLKLCIGKNTGDIYV